MRYIYNLLTGNGYSLTFLAFYLILDDGWLDISPTELDEMLASAAGRRADNMQSFNMNTLADTMKSFMGNVSSVDGVEFPSSYNSRWENADLMFYVGLQSLNSSIRN